MTGKPKLRWTQHSDLAIKRRPCVCRDEYLDYMTFQRNERPLFTEIFGPIIGLKEEWSDQGASPEELDFSAFEYRCQHQASVAVNVGFMGGSETVVLDQTDEYRIYRDPMGRTMKMPRQYATIALPLDFPVKTMDDWLAFKGHYEFSEQRFGSDWEARANEHIHAELEYKIPPMVATGGCVLGLDHRIPNGTLLANYRYYIAKAWEIMNREATKLV